MSARYQALCADCGGKTIGLAGTKAHALRMADGHRRLTYAHRVAVVVKAVRP